MINRLLFVKVVYRQLRKMHEICNPSAKHGTFKVKNRENGRSGNTESLERNDKQGFKELSY